ncbi:MarR family winged helix-turn-helix transcriptional regulator [Amycolatopsis sp. NPDC004378]
MKHSPKKPLPYDESPGDTIALGDKVAGFALTHERWLQRQLVSSELTWSELRMLAHLTRGTARMGELAEWLGMSAANATRLAAKLHDRGLVGRVGEPGNRRVVRLGITAAGRTVLEHGYRRHLVRVAALYESALTASERARLTDLLTRLEKAMRDDTPQPEAP